VFVSIDKKKNKLINRKKKMPSQSGDSKYQHRLWHIDPEAHAPALMIPTVDLLAAAAGDINGGKDGRGGPPTDPLFPSLLIPPTTALGTMQMPLHPATSSSVNHRVAWDQKNALTMAAASGNTNILNTGEDGSLGGGGGGASFISFLASRPRAVFRALNTPSPNSNRPSNAGGVIGANPMYSAVKSKCNVLVGMGKNTSSTMLASSGLQDAMFLRGLWVETGMPNPYAGGANGDD
jgi:hypothetical protein